MEDAIAGGRVGQEGEEAAKHDVEEDTRGPDVRWEGVGVAWKEDLGRAEQERANTLDTPLLVQENFRQTEIDEQGRGLIRLRVRYYHHVF